MNELIKKLALDAGLLNYVDHETPRYYFINGHAELEDVVKFAELIVQECAEQILAKGTDFIDFAPSQTGVRPEYSNMAQQIKKHFGVK